MKKNYYAVLFIVAILFGLFYVRFESVPWLDDGTNPTPPPTSSTGTSSGLTGTWTKKGVVLTDSQGINEPSVIYDEGKFKMWYRLGWDTGSVGYATSQDGLTWTKYSGNPVLTSGNPHGPYVFKYGSTYYMYATDNWDSVYLYTSDNGISWASDGAVLSPSGSGWDGSHIGNVCVWVEGSQWKMIYEASGSKWQLGIATSSDGKVWTKSSSNPIVSDGGGPDVIKSGNTYYMWYHAGQLPTQIYLATSTNLVTWSSRTLCILNTEPWEASQTADPSVVTVGGTVWMFYTGVQAQTPGAQSIGAAQLS